MDNPNIGEVGVDDLVEAGLSWEAAAGEKAMVPIKKKQTWDASWNRMAESFLGSSYKDPITSFSLFQKFSVEHPDVYWSIVLNELSLSFRRPPSCILDTSDKSKPRGTWLPGAVFNIAECCLLPSQQQRRGDDSIALVWRDEGYDHMNVNRMTLKELREQVMLVANALDATFSKGDAICRSCNDDPCCYHIFGNSTRRICCCINS
ncbi:probable acyl-activating enzyme 18, peroxisomal [Eucalyptus grandis]|uniref:probable acyl-activating enzyme 18, peroxisomal n=1 Tax=Eucalyptus grandis TaxID=71139 RepID=UPI00192F0187|nr:probable acyl-activating enzyme 18, peroxisomal [Eucalyptus grandis]